MPPGHDILAAIDAAPAHKRNAMEETVRTIEMEVTKGVFSKTHLTALNFQCLINFQNPAAHVDVLDVVQHYIPVVIGN